MEFLVNLFFPPKLTYNGSTIDIKFRFGKDHCVNITEIKKLSITKLRFGFYNLHIYDGSDHAFTGLRKSEITRIAFFLALYEITAKANGCNEKSLFRPLTTLTLVLEGKNAIAGRP